MTRCKQCDKPMGPVETMLGPVCGRCCRLNHRRTVEGRPAPHTDLRDSEEDQKNMTLREDLVKNFCGRWHVPEAIDRGRHLFGATWNPDDATVEEVEEILFNLGMDAREKWSDGEHDPR